jgi:hypothetical protein
MQRAERLLPPFRAFTECRLSGRASDSISDAWGIAVLSLLIGHIAERTTFDTMGGHAVAPLWVACSRGYETICLCRFFLDFFAAFRDRSRVGVLWRRRREWVVIFPFPSRVSSDWQLDGNCGRIMPSDSEARIRVSRPGPVRRYS